MTQEEQLDWQTHQSRSIGEIKRLLHEVLEAQEKHSQKFDVQTASTEQLKAEVVRLGQQVNRLEERLDLALRAIQVILSILDDESETAEIDAA